MIKIVVSTTLDRTPQTIISADKTVNEVLADYGTNSGFDVSKGGWAINGRLVPRDQFGKSFAELGLDGSAVFLTNVVEAKNA